MERPDFVLVDFIAYIEGNQEELTSIAAGSFGEDTASYCPKVPATIIVEVFGKPDEDLGVLEQSMAVPDVAGSAVVVVEDITTAVAASYWQEGLIAEFVDRPHWDTLVVMDFDLTTTSFMELIADEANVDISSVTPYYSAEEQPEQVK